MILPVQVTFRKMERSDAAEAKIRHEASHLEPPGKEVLL
jgi:hypothetical protein